VLLPDLRAPQALWALVVRRETRETRATTATVVRREIRVTVENRAP
jgi:hypothetical protein